MARQRIIYYDGKIKGKAKAKSRAKGKEKRTGKEKEKVASGRAVVLDLFKTIS